MCAKSEVDLEEEEQQDQLAVSFHLTALSWFALRLRYIITWASA